MEPQSPRRPGELVFTLFLIAASLVLLWSAYGIAGFEALSSPGAVPMATTAVMLLAALAVLRQTLARPRGTAETVRRDILPGSVVLTIAMIVSYAVLLRPVGFLPVTTVFLAVMIWALSRRAPWFCIAVSVATVLPIWLVFRIVFSVLMPAGIVPESRIIAFFSTLF